MTSSGDDIVVTGIGAVCSLGDGAASTFDALLRGETGIGEPWEGVGPVARVRGQGLSTGTSLARWAADQALGDDRDPDGLAVIGGSTAGDMVLGEHAFARHLRGERLEDPLQYLWPQPCYRPAQQLAEALRATGPTMTASTACTSGAMAIAVGAELLLDGRARRVLAVGTDALCRITTSGFASLGLHSPRACRPFDDERDGMCLGEGAAALVLERAEDAARRGARPLARVLGWGNAQDAHHLSTPDPAGGGAIRAMGCALRAARCDPSDIGYVNAHGTGTLLNDAMEATALTAVVPNAPVSSTKGATGHTLGAAGALEAVFTLLALRDGVLPPNTGLRASSLPLDLVRTARPARLDLAMTVNFAFGGHNTAIVFGRAA